MPGSQLGEHSMADMIASMITFDDRPWQLSELLSNRFVCVVCAVWVFSMDVLSVVVGFLILLKSFRCQVRFLWLGHCWSYHQIIVCWHFRWGTSFRVFLELLQAMDDHVRVFSV